MPLMYPVHQFRPAFLTPPPINAFQDQKYAVGRLFAASPTRLIYIWPKQGGYMAAHLTSGLRIQRQAGFTLIELMVTVAVIAILAAVAVPAYTDYVTRGKIPEATSTLASMRIQLEQYYQDNRNYNADDASCGVPNPPPGNFSYSCTGTNQSYLIQATGVASKGMNGFTYTIDQAGARQTTSLPTSAWGTTPANCWIVKKGGGC